jgi:poly(A) polymerase
VRFVGDAEARIREAVLRLLLFYRFLAHHGRGQPDPAARAACRAMADQLPTLSAERLRDETLKLLTAHAPHDTLVLMHNDKVLAAYLPEAIDIARLSRLVTIERRWDERVRAGDPVRRLAILLRDPDTAGPVAERLRFSNKDRERLVTLRATVPFTPPLDERSIRRECYRLGPELLIDRALLHWAVDSNPDNAALERMLDAAESWEPVSLPVKGDDVLALGVPAGEAVGSLLRLIEDWWIERDFKPSREETLIRLKQVVGPRAASA